MTVGEFLKLPSRQRDAIVAEHAMGLRVRFERKPLGWKESAEIGSTDPNDVLVWREDYVLLNEDGTVKTCMYLPGGYGVQCAPNFTTDPARALEVLDKMRDAGYAYGHWTTPPNSSFLPGICVALRRSVRPPEWRGTKDSRVIAETFPLAASAAALLALGVLTQ